MSKTKLILTFLMTYITIAGLVTFSLFICEEAFQTVMFGTWPAQDAKQWNIVKDGTVMMGKINLTGKIINYGIGWIQPLAFFSYRAYFKSADYYMTALESKCFANAPELFVGERVKFEFTPRSIRWSKHHNGFILENGRIQVLCQTKPNFLQRMTIEGIIEQTENKFLIRSQL